MTSRSIRIGSNLSRKVHIGAVPDQRKIAFDVDHSAVGVHIASDLTREQAVTVRDALTEAIEALLAIPDIELNWGEAYSTEGVSIVNVTLDDGTKLTLANWRDYRGWEVRPFAGQNGSTKSVPITYGWLTKKSGDLNGPEYEVEDLAKGKSERGFRRVDEALKALVRAAFR